MDLGLKSKKVLVQGSSSGLGFAIGQALAQEGAKVALCSRNKERIEQAAASIPAAVGFVADLDQRGQSSRLVGQVIERFQGLDVLVINTGGPKEGDFAALTLKDWQEGFDKLFYSAIETIQAALPVMQKNRWGRIILCSSTSAKEPISALTISSAFRSGLSGLAKTLSQQLASYGITVNVIMPGFIATQRLYELDLDIANITQEIPLKRLGKPEEVGALACFLASEQAGYITGQLIACDGGRIRSL